MIKMTAQQQKAEIESLMEYCPSTENATVENIPLVLHHWNGWQAFAEYRGYHFLCSRYGSGWAFVRVLEHPYTDPDKILRKIQRSIDKEFKR
jgi:hypothetical protein